MIFMTRSFFMMMHYTCIQTAAYTLRTMMVVMVVVVVIVYVIKSNSASEAKRIRIHLR